MIVGSDDLLTIRANLTALEAGHSDAAPMVNQAAVIGSHKPNRGS